ncbi:MAG: acetyl/propionyl/methylcrotonyl-CoA carboxylase subunit alpha [Xanthobacteraceae bacterium]|nr:acetyl/propionyl/methylcrotonyl-CoA carboxylase subunit alpha [Xanthobacteraceae bacterium]
MIETPALYGSFRTLLIANRGEIACRVIRTAKSLGLRTVAVFSEADRNALHVTQADDAVLLGPARARDSYLNIDRVIDAARKTGAEAIHPGYGFLSESAEFAERCQAEGLIFVGPTGGMIRAMGSKSGSKALMEAAGVPLVPGYHGEAQDEATLQREAEKIGFPVLIKASAGGGGRGMRIVRQASDLGAAIASAKREALAAFSDDRVLIEKYIENPRHIEVQVIGDSHGNLVSLFERECTLQRRHQKVIEEAPSPTLDDDQREAVCAAARKAAGAVNYVGAGTIEFVSDGRDTFFIEMNTRLQVEHPVTEYITGIDLVEWQLRVAFGEPLPRTQSQVKCHGHAIEARIYAENPAKNFMPSVGTIKTWRMQERGYGRRVDEGYREGDTVSPNYDAMLAKAIAWGHSREEAIDRLSDMLDQSDIRGVVTNIPFLSALLAHPDVADNVIDTGFIERELAALTPAPPAPTPLELAAAIAGIFRDEARDTENEADSPWFFANWMQVGRRKRKFTFRQGATEFTATVLENTHDNRTASVEIAGEVIRLASVTRARGMVDVELGDLRSQALVIREGQELYVRTRNGRFDLHWVDPFGVDEQEHAGDDRIVAPLPGTVVAILAREGERIAKGAPILTLEVMKMEQTLRAPFDGTVTAIKCKVGDIVQEGVELADVEPDAG